MYKLIVADMDGTLLTSDKRVTPGVKKAIDDARKAGIYFSVSTGRPEPSVMRYMDDLDLDIPAVLYNGVMIRDLKTMDVHFRVQLSFDSAKTIVEEGLKRDTTIIMWANGRFYTNRIDERVNSYKQLSRLEPLLIVDMEDFRENGVEKILWIDTPENIAKYREECGAIQDVACTTSDPQYLEFFNCKVSKAVATEKLCEMLGITIDDCVAIGDGMNDAEMLQAAGLGVAMANASDAVKRLADECTDATNDEDGVAEVIYNIIELNKLW